jgi:hypothetical protein
MQASYSEALDYFKQAESISPGFWKKNQVHKTWHLALHAAKLKSHPWQVMLAQCEKQLQHPEEARRWVTSALALPVVTTEDAKAHEEAKALLATLPVDAAKP